ncbi:MAG: TIGR03857 family LLM class F420-dependent oxidoreductase [Ilumatobacteraceae bacterium]|nr:TIGR03857 family LLM class F420-dependent oxidoreductase [Ilumatobacteraceae bacterium]
MALTHPDFGCYLLAGGAQDPRALLDEVRDADRLGLSTAFISERFNVKEAASLTGAAVAASSQVTIATAATNHTTRHPIVTASWALTLQRLSRGRFMLGLGRGIPVLFDAFGIPKATTAQLDDIAGLLRRLWHGEVVVGHDGPAGSWPVLTLDPEIREDIPLALVAFGPNTLELGGRVFDHVILHTFFTDETLQRCVRTVKRAAEQAGRDPDDVVVWSCYATIGDHLPEAVRLQRTVGRLATYLQGYGDLMVSTNDWDARALANFRNDNWVAGFRRAIDVHATTAELEHVASLLPEEWLEPAATGSPAQCAAAVKRQLELGADRVILHGASPAELEPILTELR